MTKPDKESIETFMNITGVTEPVAVQKLEAYHGNLNEAVNAYFSEGDGSIRHQTSGSAPQDDAMDIDDPLPAESQIPPFLPARSLNPLSLFDNSFGESLFNRGTSFPSHRPIVSHPREVREIPIEVKDVKEQSGHSGVGPIIEDVTGTADVPGQESRGTVIIDVEDDKDVSTTHVSGHSTAWRTVPGPSAPGIDILADSNNDIEEEMVRAAIEASKKDASIGSSNHHFHADHSNADDIDLVQEVSVSLKAAEQEKKMRELGEGSGVLDSEPHQAAEMLEPERVSLSNGRQSRWGLSSSPIVEEVEDAEEQPLVRHRNRQASSSSLDAAKEIHETEVTAPSSPQQLNNNHVQNNERDFHSDEWGGISSEEHDEAVMLEAAIFGGIPEGSGYHFPYASQHYMQNGLDRTAGYYSRPTPRPPSPSLTARRLIREQQDDEYFASLQADREKELKAKEEAEARRLEELAAREAALEEERLREEESRRKLEEEQEIERQLAAKEASLPQEPTSDDENAVTLLVRLPDGSRRGRRFLKSDILQHLFDFIDVSRAVKPGTYRLIRPYPRRAFGGEECTSTLDELGLTSKQEALFLELI